METAEKQEGRMIHQFFVEHYIQNTIMSLFPELSGEKDRWVIRLMTADVMKVMKKLRSSELHKIGQSFSDHSHSTFKENLRLFD